MGPPLLSTLLSLLVLLQGVIESGALVKCYQCSYFKDGDKKVDRNCKEMEQCGECMSLYYQKGDIELVVRDCVERCVPGMVPVKYPGIDPSETGDESCCASDLCNNHPSAADRTQISRKTVVSLVTLVLVWTTLL